MVRTKDECSKKLIDWARMCGDQNGWSEFILELQCINERFIVSFLLSLLCLIF